MTNTKPIRVLVVDDSVVNRRNIADNLNASPEVEVIAKAANGEEALQLALLLKPDVVTLDLEMPKMDGFTFLRILMSRQPTPVVVVSSYGQKENVFKALELGALDFVVKPDRQTDAELSSIRRELLSKVLVTRDLRPSTLAYRPRMESLSGVAMLPKSTPSVTAGARHLVAIASSTGGPSALMQLLSALPDRFDSSILIAQHMPDRFTRTFAQRLDRRARISVAEAQDQDLVLPGRALVCPGRRSMQVEGRLSDSPVRARILTGELEDRYVPSADRLFKSVADAAGSRAIGLILTGMGDDGVQGAKAILDAGGVVIAESEETAIVYGMPGAAVRAGVVTRTMPLGRITDYVRSLGEGAG